jgi:hypothetical protein
MGGLAQLGEHLLCKQGVNGSIPLASTNYRKQKSGIRNRHVEAVMRRFGKGGAAVQQLDFWFFISVL